MIKLNYVKYTRSRIHFTSRYQNEIIQYIDTIISKKHKTKIPSFENYKKYFRNCSFNFAEKGATYYFKSGKCDDRYDIESFNDIKPYLKPTNIALISKIYSQNRITPLGIFKVSMHSYNMTNVKR